MEMDIWEVFRKIRKKRPLIHMIPNTVSAALCADGLAALGARPLMAVAPEEMPEILFQADACVINLGQLNQEKKEAARQALLQVERYKKLVVLDPVGCGASTFRMEAVQELLDLPWSGILKGNASEIYSIQQRTLTQEGIDSLEQRYISEDASPGRVYLVTGASDCILWQKGKLELSHQTPVSRNIVGTGCLAGAVAGACLGAAASQDETEFFLLEKSEREFTGERPASSIERNMIKAAAAASLGMEYVLEEIEKCTGYGAAKSALLDSLGRLSEKEFLDWLKRRLR